MPHDDPGPQDPLILVGVGLPSGPEAPREMAYVFAEEFARMGYGADRILGLFRQPFYAAAHGAYRTLGEPAVRAIIDECAAVFGRARVRVRDAAPPAARPTEREEAP